jgi:hypothetical protein
MLSIKAIVIALHASQNVNTVLMQPTQRDIDNAQSRQEIADRFALEYGKVLSWALGAFGPGWLPSHRHFLVDKDEEDRARRAGERPRAAATVYTVRHETTREAKHFTVEGDQVKECDGYMEAFGPMLAEPHPTQRIEVHGQLVAPHRYSLCWSDIPLYEPKSAEELAALRVSRGKGREQRADKKWVEDNPLLAQAGIRRQDVDGRSR